jgi:hypothetical protein
MISLTFDARFGSTIGPMFAITRGQIFWLVSQHHLVGFAVSWSWLGREEADGKEAQTGSRAQGLREDCTAESGTGRWYGDRLGDVVFLEEDWPVCWWPC